MDSQNLRIEGQTLENLKAYKNRLQVWADSAHRNVPEWMHGRQLSLSDAVRHLITMQAKHSERSKRSVWDRRYTLPDRADSGKVSESQALEAMAEEVRPGEEEGA